MRSSLDCSSNRRWAFSSSRRCERNKNTKKKIRKKKYEKKKERTELISHMYVAHKVKREILIKDVWETKA